MKKLILIPALFCLFMLNVASMCSSDDDNSSNNPGTGTVTDNVTTGTWRVTSFQEDGTNNTSQFTGYAFSINTNGSMVAVNGSVTKTGTWSTYLDSGLTKFDIMFPDTSGPFESISEDWRVLSSTATKLELKHISGGDGSIDLLTFEKN
ncbi:hypothetical protein ACSVH2_05730 [Flavobacterium sp. RSB2_4_14]|uniref:hypothetical protein n=1 Tax=Flavobacterium sp. RSB2_4_14 TaxID=3447665 RepID=UPI003F2B8CBB